MKNHSMKNHSMKNDISNPPVNILPLDLKAAIGKLPTHMQDSVIGFIAYGLPPGSFLTSVFSNDLVGSFGRADSVNRMKIGDYVEFLYNSAPHRCWGSEKKVGSWIELGGLAGIIKGLAL